MKKSRVQGVIATALVLIASMVWVPEIMQRHEVRPAKFTPSFLEETAATEAPQATDTVAALGDVAELVERLRGLEQRNSRAMLSVAPDPEPVRVESLPVPPEATIVPSVADTVIDVPLVDLDQSLAAYPLRAVLVGEDDARALLGKHLVAPGAALEGGLIQVVSIVPGKVQVQVGGELRWLTLPEFETRKATKPATPGLFGSTPPLGSSSNSRARDAAPSPQSGTAEAGTESSENAESEGTDELP